MLSAIIWGCGDFSGGVAARRHDPFQVLALAAISGSAILIILMLLNAEPIPTLEDILWSTAAGVSGAMGIAALYRGLSFANPALVAPSSAVIGVLLPVVVGTLTQGLPAINQLAGLLLGMGGIWLVTRTPASDIRDYRQGLRYATLAGVGFGGFFILIAQVGYNYIFGPLVITKLVSLVVGLVVLMLRKLRFPPLKSNPPALIAGVLDAGGNIFYILAVHYTRLDMAALLSSMYPAVTVLLSVRLLHEGVTRVQWLGVILCGVAIALIVI